MRDHSRRLTLLAGLAPVAQFREATSASSCSAVASAAVRALRTERGLTQEELAARAQLHVVYLSGIERGERNPSVAIVGRLARALGLTLSELVRRAEEP